MVNVMFYEKENGYYCTKCKHNHVSGKIYDDHIEHASVNAHGINER